MEAVAGHAVTPDAKEVSLSARPRLGRLASQFALLSAAEVVCRIVSLAVVLELVRRVGREGYGRIEFCFNLVYWLIFVIRDGVELVFYRELARRARPNRRIIGAYISLKLQLALALWAMLIVASFVFFQDSQDRLLLSSYGVLLIPTAVGLDNVFRSRERAGIVAMSLVIRTSLYAGGVWLAVQDASRLTWVPWLFFTGEMLGIALVWGRFTAEFGPPQLNLRRGRRFAGPVLAQGRGILGVQLSQVVLSSMDVMIVGFLESWSMVGLYGAPHRIVTAAVTFAVIFQQVLLPQLVRSWISRRDRQTAEIRRIIAAALLVIIPAALVVSLTSRWIIGLLFTPDFAAAAPLLAIGIWRVPIMVVSSIHVTTLVATHREREGLRILAGCLVVAMPLVVVMHYFYGLPGTSVAMVMVAAMVAVRTGIAVHRRHDVIRPGRTESAECMSQDDGGRMDGAESVTGSPHVGRKSACSSPVE